MLRTDEQSLTIADELYNAAVDRMQLALEGQSAALVKGTLEALCLPAFVCATTGTVQALTLQAEELVRGERGLTLRDQRLRAVRDEDDRTLSDAIAAAARGLERPNAPVMQTVLVRGTRDMSLPLVLEVMSVLPSAVQLAGAPRVIVVARGSRGADTHKAALLQGGYGLTSAETEIALQLARGESTRTIAQQRKVAVGTVRAQIKSMLAKLGVSRQVELVAKLNEF